MYSRGAGGGAGAGAGGGATTAGGGGAGAGAGAAGAGAGAGGGGAGVGAGAGAGAGAAGAGAEATVATGRFGHPVNRTARARQDSANTAGLNRVSMSLFPPVWAISRSVLEDLRGAHGDGVETPPVLLPRVL